MLVDLVRIHLAPRPEKSRDQGIGPGVELAGRPDKLFTHGGLSNRQNPSSQLTYAVLRGRTVKSRTWVRMLDICIPFSCDTNGKISAINWSLISSLISS